LDPTLAWEHGARLSRVAPGNIAVEIEAIFELKN